MTLTEFLLARIDETEAIAQRAKYGEEPDESMAWGYFADCCNGVHIHCNPDVILAECATKRRILDLHQPERIKHTREDGEWHWTGEVLCYTCGSLDGNGLPAPCPTLLALALPYVGHPDFQEEWRA